MLNSIYFSHESKTTFKDELNVELNVYTNNSFELALFTEQTRKTFAYGRCYSPDGRVNPSALDL